MNNVKNLHHQAMAFADEAFKLKQNGEYDKAIEIFRLAFEKEREAANLVINDLSLEPTRSVLLRSAATLALDCKELREAERLAALGIAGNPPYEIAEELRNLYEQVNFHRHLELQEVTLVPEEFQLSLSGNAVGVGIASGYYFLNYVRNLEAMIIRTAERISGEEYRKSGQPAKWVNKLRLFLAVPRAASFAVSFRFGEAKQTTLPGMSLAEDAISEFMQCIELFNRSEEEALKKRIPEEPYFRNFMGLALNIAPDGDNINQVGFTAVRAGKEKTVALTRKKEEIRLAAKCYAVEEPEEELIKIEGMLKYASSITGDEIKLIDDQNKSHTIIVPEGLMDDIVRPMWDYKVMVTGTKKRKKILLANILRVDDENS